MKYKRKVLTKPSEENNQLNESTHSRKGKRFGFEHWHMDYSYYLPTMLLL